MPKKKKRLVLGRGNRSKTVILRAYVRQDLKIFQIQFHVFYQPEEGQIWLEEGKRSHAFHALNIDCFFVIVSVFGPPVSRVCASDKAHGDPWPSNSFTFYLL